MILSDYDIGTAIDKGEIKIESDLPLYLGPCSVDLHLDNKAFILSEKKMLELPEGDRMLDIAHKERAKDLFEEYSGWDGIIIHPGEFYILSSVEKITFDKSTVGFIQGRSSIARMGLNIHAAGFFDAGFSGTATLEVTNFTKYPIHIPKHTRICQMVFARTETPCMVSYAQKVDSKYQGQSGPTLSEVHQDHEKD